jgi:hypothetical protein
MPLLSLSLAGALVCPFVGWAGILTLPAHAAREVVCRKGNGVNDCHGQLVEIRLRYTGEGCDATTNTQNGAASCDGGARFAEPLEVLVSSPSRTIFVEAEELRTGDVIDVSARDAGRHALEDSTEVSLGRGLETVSIATSCTQSLAVGDKFGSLEVVGMTSTAGGTVAQVGPESSCSIQGAVAAAPTRSTLRLTGSFCAGPAVLAGQPGGEFTELPILDAGDDFIEVPLRAVGPLETCVVVVECPCKRCTSGIARGRSFR